MTINCGLLQFDNYFDFYIYVINCVALLLTITNQIENSLIIKKCDKCYKSRPFTSVVFRSTQACSDGTVVVQYLSTKIEE